MTMVVSRGQRIYFRFEGERGAYLLLHHGLFGSHQDWYQAGYVEALAREFRLVIPDARGHGRSDHPTSPEDYRQDLMAEDLVEIMNDLGIRNVHVLGYSLGALVGFALLRRHPERVRIAVLGGESPLVQPAQKELWAQQLAHLRQTTLTDHLAGLRERQALVRAELDVDESLAHPAACALLQAMQGWEPPPAERLTVNSPLTLFAGSRDPALPGVELARGAVSRARLVVFPGQTHAGLFAQREALSQELLRLLKSGRRQDEGDAAAARGEASTTPRAPDAAPDPTRRQDAPPPREERRDEPRSGRMAPRGALPSQAAGPQPFTPPQAEQAPPAASGVRAGTETEVAPAGASPTASQGAAPVPSPLQVQPRAATPRTESPPAGPLPPQPAPAAAPTAQPPSPEPAWAIAPAPGSGAEPGTSLPPAAGEAGPAPSALAAPGPAQEETPPNGVPEEKPTDSEH